MIKMIKFRTMTKHTPRPIFVCLMVLLTISIFIPQSGHAELTPIEDACLEEIWGTSGISIAVKNVQIFHHIDSIKYCASDNGAIAFNDFSMQGTEGIDVALFNFDFGSVVSDSGIIHIDAFESLIAPVNDWTPGGFTEDQAYYRGMTSTIIPDWDQYLTYRIGDIELYDPDYDSDPVSLGSFIINEIDMPRSATFTSPPIDGSGFDFQHSFQMTIDKIGYAYNTSCAALELCPTYIGENFVDSLDAPEHPSSWMPNRSTPVDFGDFQFGDLFGDIDEGIFSNPASIHVGEGDLYDNNTIYGAVSLNLPMTGSIRFENADFNGTDFGPGAIDGIDVHRLNLQLIP